jgi:hypothetical protein
MDLGSLLMDLPEHFHGDIDVVPPTMVKPRPLREATAL